MLRPNINIKRRISPGSKIIIAFFSSFMMAFLGAVFVLSSSNFYNSSTEVEKVREVVSKDGVESGPTENPKRSLISPSPTSFQIPPASPITTPILTPNPTVSPMITPSPTDTLQIPQTTESEDLTSSQGGNYSGPGLEPASEKKDLLILSDSLPEDWPIEKNEGANFVSGKVGKALFLNPGELVFSNSETFANAGTLSFWLKLESEATNGESPLIDWNFEGGDYQPSLFEISVVESRLLFSIYNEVGNQDDISGQLETPFEWHYIVVTWDLTKEPYERVLYFDGKKVASGGFPFAMITSKPSLFQIGGTLGSRNPVSFKIDELVLINWAKSESEIVQ